MTKKLIFPILLISIFLMGCTSIKNTPYKACTEEARLCNDGSSVARIQPNCEFAQCPTETGFTTGTLPPQVCDMDAKLCPDGNSVGRLGPNCEFAPCPITEITPPKACTMEAKLCPDGSAVGRSGPNCEFAACSGEVPSSCSCPEGYKQEGEVCTPNCYYSTPKCLMPSIQCK